MFDLDGTLVNSLNDIAGTLNEVRKKHGLPPHETEFVRSRIGHGIENLVQNCFPEVGAELIPLLVTEYRSYYAENPAMGGSAYPDAEKTLLALRKWPHVKIGIVTNKPTRIAELTLKHYLPAIQFDVIYGPEKVSKAKPHAEHLLEALAFINVLPENAWFIGDDPVDAECAKRASVRFYGAGYGFGKVQVAPAEMLSSPHEILVKVAPVLNA